MARLPVSTFYFRDDPIPSAESFGYPPFEGGLLLDTIGDSLFRQLNRVRVLDVLEIDPIR